MKHEPLSEAKREIAEEVRIQRAVDEALENAALIADKHLEHDSKCIGWIARDIRQLKSPPRPLPSTMKHGVDCPKVEHKAGGVMYFHPASHDHSYTMAPAQWDEIRYCGRCHQAL